MCMFIWSDSLSAWSPLDLFLVEFGGIWPSSSQWMREKGTHGTNGTLLVGGLEHFSFFHVLGIVIPINFHIFQRGGSTTNQSYFRGIFAGDRDPPHIH